MMITLLQLLLLLMMMKFNFDGTERLTDLVTIQTDTKLSFVHSQGTGNNAGVKREEMVEFTGL